MADGTFQVSRGRGSLPYGKFIAWFSKKIQLTRLAIFGDSATVWSTSRIVAMNLCLMADPNHLT